jgi:hypothetical protein
VTDAMLTQRGPGAQRNSGPERPLAPGSAALLRAAQPVSLELDSDGAVGVDGDVAHEVEGDP